MQEHSVTVGGVIHTLKEPFFVMATQNPIEQEGTYPLPEAQLDRFMFKLVVGYSTREELATILDRTTRGEQPKAEQVIDGETLIAMQALVREVIVAPHVQDYAIRLALATHPEARSPPRSRTSTSAGVEPPRRADAGPRRQGPRACSTGGTMSSFEDLRRVYLPGPPPPRPAQLRGPGRGDRRRRGPAQGPRRRPREGRGEATRAKAG